MSLSFGLNVRKKDNASAQSKPSASKATQKSIFSADDSDDGVDGNPTQSLGPRRSGSESITVFDEETTLKPSKKVDDLKSSKSADTPRAQAPKGLGQRQSQKPPVNLSALRTAQQHSEKDQAVDPSIYDYDAAFDALHAASNARKAATAKDAAERRPRYMDNLLASAETRKKDQLRAQDKAIQREREAEGDEFADKEKFVTGAYREAQEEAQRLEEEEKAREARESQQRREQGMSRFYKGVMNQREKDHAEMVRLAAEMAPEEIAASAEKPAEKTDAELAAELNKKGRNIEINDEGQVTDKRELLSAGLNVIPKKPKLAAAVDPKDVSASRSTMQNQHQSYERRDGRAAQRERQSRMIEQQLEAAAKRQAEEELEEEERRKKAAKSQKSETEISSARERFLARKREREAEAAKKK